MSVERIIKRTLSFSPIIEIIVRTIYYSNIKFLKRYAYFYRVNPYLKLPKRKTSEKKRDTTKQDLDNIFKMLSEKYISKGDLVLLHCSYRNIKNAGYSPNEFIDLLLNIIGKEGTLAMSARPDFDINLDSFMRNEKDQNLYHYDPKKTKSNTGIVAEMLLKKDGSIRSDHPINSMVAYGPLASHIMKNNLIDENSLAHGINSSWYKCVLNKAKVLAIGVELVQSSTVTHCHEDVLVDKWPVKNWYITKKYKIIKNDKSKILDLKERAPKWLLNYAERTIYKDFINNKILHCYDFKGLSVEIAEAEKMYDFFSKRFNKAYPYFFTNLNLSKFIER